MPVTVKPRRNRFWYYVARSRPELKAYEILSRHASPEYAGISCIVKESNVIRRSLGEFEPGEVVTAVLMRELDSSEALRTGIPIDAWGSNGT